MGSSLSTSADRLVSYPGELDRAICESYVWMSELGEEFALVFRTVETAKPGICAFAFNQKEECRDKLIFTFYDALCQDNFVAVNIEFEAERDGDGNWGFKFGGITVKDFGEKYKRRPRPVESDLLFLSYEMGGRRNQFTFHRQGDEYIIVFDSYSFMYLHNTVKVICSPELGLLAYAVPLIEFDRKKIHNPDTKRYYVDARNDVVKNINDIRRKLKGDDNNNTGSSQHIHNSGNLVYNERNFGGGNIYQHDDSNQRGQKPWYFCTLSSSNVKHI